jgi:hypothetical protein
MAYAHGSAPFFSIVNLPSSILAVVACLLLASGLGAPAAETNVLVWDKAAGHVGADIRGEPLRPLLENIAQQTGWHVFVEPGTERNASTKFKDLPPDAALRMLLGNLNFAFVPQTNGPDFLYVFTTQRENATQPVWPGKPVLKAQRHVANELIVKLKPGADIEALAKLLGAKITGRDDKLGIYRLEFPDGAATDAALGQLQGNSEVAAVDYNFIFDPPPSPQAIANVPPVSTPALTLDPSTPNDPCSPVVGLIDTQVQSLGSQLDPILLPTVSVVGNLATNNSPVPTHGTAMANAMAQAVALASNGKSSVRILPVVIYDASETTTSWNVALGVQAAVNGGATVLNLSLGGTSDSAVLNDIVNQALARGIVIFAAAGNEPVSAPTYPAAITGVNDVTALGQPGQLASYANFSPQVDLALPGTSYFSYGGQTFAVQGTSPATASASGIAAGTKGLNCATWAQIQAAMQQKFPVPKK